MHSHRARGKNRHTLGCVKFLNNQSAPYELTYSDVFMVPSKSSVGSRMGVDLSTNDGTGTTIPIVVSNMTAISGHRMAETTARRGGIAILPQDVPADIAAETIRKVKSAGLVFDAPIVVKIEPRDAFDQLAASGRKLAPVVDADGALVGILTGKGALRATLYKPAVDA